MVRRPSDSYKGNFDKQQSSKEFPSSRGRERTPRTNEFQNYQAGIRTNGLIVLRACSPDIAERPKLTLLSRSTMQRHFIFWWSQISNRLHTVFISTVLSSQHYRKFQFDRRCFWYISLISMGKIAMDARFCPHTVGKARCNTNDSSPVGVCANRGERGGYRLAFYCGLPGIVNGPQVEEEARYESVGALRYERARPTKALLRRLQTPFCISNKSH